MEQKRRRHSRSQSRSPVRGSSRRGHASGSRRRGDEGGRESTAAPRISNDDYYRLNAPFRLWLRKEKDRYFDEMGSVKARRYFDSFVRAWNDGRLSPKYYKQDGELSSLSKSVVTRHDWGLAADAGQQLAAARHRPLTANTVGQPRGAHDPAQDRLADEVRRDDERRRRKRERREAKEREELFLDEVAPKETGREAKIAKKRNLNQARHGEKSPDMDIPDDDLFRDTGDDLAALKRDRDAHERRQQARRQAARTAQGRETRIKEHADRERSTVEALRAMAEQSREQGLGMMRRPAPP